MSPEQLWLEDLAEKVRKLERTVGEIQCLVSGLDSMSDVNHRLSELASVIRALNVALTEPPQTLGLHNY